MPATSSAGSETWEHLSELGGDSPVADAVSGASASPAGATSSESAPETNPSDLHAPPPLPPSVASTPQDAREDGDSVSACAGEAGDFGNDTGSNVDRADSRESWEAADRGIADLRLQTSERPELPAKRRTEVINIALVGRPQTGKTTLGNNLFSPLSGDPAFALPPTRACDAAEFVRDCSPVITSLETYDVSDNVQLQINIMEYPGLPDTSAATRNAMFAHWDTLDEDYAAQQRTPYIEAEARVDRRVHAVVYCLPQHERLRAGDAAAMRRLFAAKPGFPVMFQGDAFDERRLRECAADFAANANEHGIAPYEPPADVVATLYAAMCGSGTCWSAARTLQWPLHLVLGDTVDEAICAHPHTRTTRLGKINAYQSDLSDLPVLRRLLIEVGFWDIKREAERRYCAAQAAKAGVPADAPAVAARSDVASQAAPDVAPLGTQCSRGPSVPTAAAAAESDSGDESDSEDEPDAPVVPPPPAEAQVDFDESAHVRTEFVDAAARTSAGDGTMRVTVQEVGAERRVCIRVGDHEGRSMEDAHRDRQVKRPNTYDVMRDILEGFGMTIVRVVVEECRDDVFYASVHVHCPGQGIKAYGARPSTAINMALRDAAAQGAPIFVHQDIVAQHHSRSAARRG